MLCVLSNKYYYLFTIAISIYKSYSSAIIINYKWAITCINSYSYVPSRWLHTKTVNKTCPAFPCRKKTPSIAKEEEACATIEEEEATKPRLIAHPLAAKERSLRIAMQKRQDKRRKKKEKKKLEWQLPSSFQVRHFENESARSWHGLWYLDKVFK